MLRTRITRLSLALTLVLLISIPNSASSFAAVKAGATCPKKSTTQIIGNRKFTCTLKNKKLVWDAGVVVTKASPSSTQTPTPTVAKTYTSASDAEENTNCNIHNTLAFSLQGPLICKDEKWQVVSRDFSISAAAFWSVLDRWNNQPASIAKLDLHIDPNAGDWTKSINTGIQAGARYWGTSSDSSPTLPVFISNDHLYIEREVAKAGIQQSEESKKRNAATTGGQAGFNSDSGNHVIYLDFVFKQIGDQNDVGFYQVGPHEYTHYAQYQLGQPKWQAAGPWFIEGMAAYVGSALGPMSGMPHNQISMWESQIARTSLSLTDFLSYDNGITQSSSWSDVYPMGAMASEALMALIGADSVYNLSADLSKGLTVDEVFKKNAGMPVQLINKLLSDYIDSIKAKKPWNLDTLKQKYSALKN